MKSAGWWCRGWGRRRRIWMMQLHAQHPINRINTAPRSDQTADSRGEEDQDPVKLLVKPCHRNCVVLGWAGLCAVTRDSFSYSHVQPGDVMPCPSRACHYYLCWILCGYHGDSAVFWPCPHHPHLISVSRHQRISNLAPHPRHQLDFAGAFINVHVSRYWRCEVHKIFYDLCQHLSDLDRRLSTGTPGIGVAWVDISGAMTRRRGAACRLMPLYATVCFSSVSQQQPPLSRQQLKWYHSLYDTSRHSISIY